MPLRIALAAIVVWFGVGSVFHFTATGLEMSIMPPWIPAHRAMVLASGVCEALGALGLLWRPTRTFALWGLFLLTLAVTPCHVYMLQRPELFNVPYWALVLRIPLQGMLLWLIAWAATRRQLK